MMKGEAAAERATAKMPQGHYLRRIDLRVKAFLRHRDNAVGGFRHNIIVLEQILRGRQRPSILDVLDCRDLRSRQRHPLSSKGLYEPVYIICRKSRIAFER